MPVYPSHDLLTSWLERLAPPPPVADAADESRPEPIVERMLLSVERSAMACQFEVLLNQYQYTTGPQRALEGLDLIEQLEGKLSVYKPHSDLSLVNRFGALRAISVSPDTLKLLQLAQDIHTLTAGAFDITAGTLSEVWGFSRRQGEMPTSEKIAAALELVGAEYVRIDAELAQVSLQREGIRTNPGGIGKGYALDRAATYLSEHGIDDFMVHGGLSSVIARGHRQHPLTGGGWLVSLRHPLRLEEVIGTIRLRDRALGTSGSGKQFFHFGGERYSHIIDPRTGWPAQGLLSATVVCQSGAVADALATALFVMGSERSREFCQRNPSISAVILAVDPKNGRSRLETFNMSEDLWLPPY